MFTFVNCSTESAGETNQANSTTSTSSKSYCQRFTLILGKRYNLTTTYFKYLDVGITAEVAPQIKLLLADNKGKQLVLSHQTWNELISKRNAVEHLTFQSNPVPINIKDLTITICPYQHGKIIKFTICGESLFLKPETLSNLFNLDLCIERTRTCTTIHHS